MQPILFFDHDRKAGLRNKKRLKAYLCNLFAKEKRPLEQARYIFCSDEYLLTINKNFLNHNYYTDVIGFDLSQTSKKMNVEIYISIDRVRDNARNERVSVKQELHRVIFHGALHFCGYRDKGKQEKEKMKRAEDKHILKYFKL